MTSRNFLTNLNAFYADYVSTPEWTERLAASPVGILLTELDSQAKSIFGLDAFVSTTILASYNRGVSAATVTVSLGAPVKSKYWKSALTPFTIEMAAEAMTITTQTGELVYDSRLTPEAATRPLLDQDNIAFIDELSLRAYKFFTSECPLLPVCSGDNL